MDPLDPTKTITSTKLYYDVRGRQDFKVDSIDEVPGLFTLSREFTPGGRLERVTNPSGRIVNFTYDQASLLLDEINTKEDDQATTEQMLFQFQAYHPFGPPSEILTGYNQTINNTSGDCGCLEGSNPGETLEIDYIYDKNRNLSDIQHLNYPSRDLHFEYDSLGMLDFASGWFGQIDYEYDKVGNRETVTMNGAVQGYGYVSGTNKLNAVTGFDVDSLSYDGAGNITERFGNTLVYNDNNRLEEVQSGGVRIAGYIYNGLGQRVVKSAGTDTIFLYDFDGHIIGEAQSDGTISKEYLYNGNSRIAMVDLSSDALYYFSNDRLGTPQMVLNSSGNVVWKARYMPFGEVEISLNPSVVNNFRFAGQYYDAETGLHYNYLRYYDPKLGRYLTPDPIGLAGGINLYIYSVNDPINGIDPWGLFRSGFGGPNGWQDFSNLLSVNGGPPPGVILPDWAEKAYTDLKKDILNVPTILIPGPQIITPPRKVIDNIIDKINPLAPSDAEANDSSSEDQCPK